MPSDPPFDPNGVLQRPGYKVMHSADYDYRSNCQPFTACLEIIRKWSIAHPHHLPIFIFVENKKFSGLKASDFDALDAEILSVFQRSELVVPDDVRRGNDTLEEAVTTGGWPTLGSTRGKIVFLLAKSEVRPAYLEGHPNLQHRVLFTNATPGDADAAFMVLPDSFDPKIPMLVRKGYLVLTRADIDTAEARRSDTARRDAALSSGAQLLSTDYPRSESARWTGYDVDFGQGLVARCNPVNSAQGCSSAVLEKSDGAVASGFSDTVPTPNGGAPSGSR
jgi:hypothetical protein